MPDRKTELLQIERERWDEFVALLELVSPDRMENATLNADGWTMKDLLWHMSSWDGEGAAVLERVRANTYEDRDYDTDGMNARFLEEGRRTDLAMVRSQFLAARVHAREVMESLSDVTAPVEEWFSETAYKHIDDHLPEVRRFVSQLDRPTQP